MDLDKLFDEAHSESGANAGDSLDSIFAAAHAAPEGSLPERAGKQFFAGGVNAAVDTLGLLESVNPYGRGYTFDPETKKFGTTSSPTTDWLKKKVNEYLPEPENDEAVTRYARRMGEFALPIPGFGGPVRQIATNTAAAIGSQGAEDWTGNKTIAPLLGALLGGSGPSVFDDGWKMLRGIFSGATPQEIKGSAALALKESTGLSADEIGQAIAKRPPDELGALMSTAEVTDNAGMAQLEKTLANVEGPKQSYNQRAVQRQGVRDELLNSLSKTDAIEPAAAGSDWMSAARKTSGEMGEEAQALWDKVDRHVPIDVTKEQGEIGRILAARMGGDKPNAKEQYYIDQFLAGENGTLPSGAIQDIRSSALKYIRDGGKQTYVGQRALGVITQGSDEALERGFITDMEAGSKFPALKAAREATKAKAETFAPATPGASLLDYRARPEGVLKSAWKGDALGVQQLKAAARPSEKQLEDLKRVVLDRIPRRGPEQVYTPGEVDKFFKANKSGLKELFGDDHFGQIERVRKDLFSEASVASKAFRSSVGNSVTSQRNTVAGVLDDIMTGAILPGTGPIGKLAESVKQTVGTQDRNSVRELLFRAALEPEYAQELASAPTSARILDTWGRLKKGIGNALTAAGQSGVKDVTVTPEAERKPPARLRAPQQAGSLLGQGSDTRQTPRLEKSSQTTPLQSQPRPNSPRYRGAALGASAQTPTAESARLQNITSSSSSPYENLNVRRSETQEVFSTLLDAVKHVESRGNTKAVSHKGAQGPYQLMPATGKEYHAKLGISEPYDPFKESQARRIAGAILKDNIEAFNGDVRKGLTAYHSGQGNVKRGTLGPRGREYSPLVEQVFQKLLKERASERSA